MAIMKLLLLSQLGSVFGFTTTTPYGLSHTMATSSSSVLRYRLNNPLGEDPEGNFVETALPAVRIETPGVTVPPVWTNSSSSSPSLSMQRFESARYAQVSETMSRSEAAVTATTISDTQFESIFEQVVSSYWGPRILLAAVACLYGTNFPLGSIMDSSLPASAATSARFVIASLALGPYIFKLHKDLIPMCILAGCFTGMGYVTQSLALVDTTPATVSFLGAATVIWCPFLEWLVDKKKMGIQDRPQTWIAATLCLLGVGILELGGGEGAGAMLANVGAGDGLAILQAIGFGTGIFLSEKMMKQHEGQALSITSVMVATTALIAMFWSISDGWIGTIPRWESMTLPNMFLDPSMSEVTFAVIWTGLLSTSMNFFFENVAIGKVSSGEASVLLATEPLWAAAFSAVLVGESFGWNDYTGGFLIVAACLANTLKPDDIQNFLLNGEQPKN